MKKVKTINLYLSEDVSIRIVSSIKDADLIINSSSCITTYPNKESVMDISHFKEEFATDIGFKLEDHNFMKDSKKTDIGFKLQDHDFMKDSKNKVIDPNELEEEICKMLINLGIPPNVKGYRYTIEAVKIVLGLPNESISITKFLYPQVASKFDTTPSRAERAIRHAIEISSKRGDKELQNKLFKSIIINGKNRATNSEFIFGLCEYFKLEK